MRGFLFALGLRAPGLPLVLMIAGVVSGLVLLDLTAMRERVFLGNLGVGRRSVVGVTVAVVLVLEGALFLLTRLPSSP